MFNILINYNFISRFLKYPQCLRLLELLQDSEFREALESWHNANFIDEQLLYQWQYYTRKRQRLQTLPAPQQQQQQQQSTTSTTTTRDGAILPPPPPAKRVRLEVNGNLQQEK